MAHPFVTDVAIAVSESAQTVDPARPLHTPGAKWTHPPVGVPGRIPLPASQSKTTAAVAATVMAPSPLRTRLQLGAAQPLKVWLNGKLVFEGQPGPSPVQPDQVAVDVSLIEGANQLLVQVSYQGDHEALYARFLDPDRQAALHQ